jgi:malic enzyme
MPLRNGDDLALAYTPGVTGSCLEIARNKEKVYYYTIKGKTVAVITNGTAVLGLGNIGPKAGITVIEGKALFFKRFAKNIVLCDINGALVKGDNTLNKAKQEIAQVTNNK